MPPDVEFEVSVLVDVVSLLVVLGLPAIVGVGIITWVVSLGLSTGQCTSVRICTSMYIKLHVHIRTLHAIHLKPDPIYADGMHLLCLYVQYIQYAEYT